MSLSSIWSRTSIGAVSSIAVKDEFESIAIGLMKRTEMIAEGLFYIGEKPTTRLASIFIWNALKEMLERDMKDVEGAIALYERII